MKFRRVAAADVLLNALAASVVVVVVVATAAAAAAAVAAADEPEYEEAIYGGKEVEAEPTEAKHPYPFFVKLRSCGGK